MALLLYRSFVVGVEEFWLPSFEMAHLQYESWFARLTESGVDLVFLFHPGPFY